MQIHIRNFVIEGTSETKKEVADKVGNVDALFYSILLLHHGMSPDWDIYPGCTPKNVRCLLIYNQQMDRFNNHS